MEPVKYENFDVLIRAWDGERYPTHVMDSPNGETRGAISFAELAPDVMTNLKSLQELLLRPVGTGRHFTLERPDDDRAAQAGLGPVTQARQLGELLFNALMSGDVGKCFEVSKSIVRRDGKGLRIRLRFEPPKLATLPWELMRDPEADEFFSLSFYSPIVRYIEQRQTVAPLLLKHPLRVLVVLSSPVDRPLLDVEREAHQMMEALADVVARGAVQVTLLRSTDLLTIQRRLRDEQYNVLHYMGHGHFSPNDGEGYLVLEDSQGTSHLVSGRTLGRLLHDERSLRFVLLNACSSSEALPDDPFSGVAASLIQAGMPAVAAMQSTISDVAALQFSRAFYEALSGGLPIEASVAEGRKAVYFSSTDTVEWVIPQLFMRLGDGVLFNFGGAADAPLSGDEARRNRPGNGPAREPELGAARRAAPPLQEVSAPPTAPPSEMPRQRAPGAPAAVQVASGAESRGGAAGGSMCLIPASRFIFGAGQVCELPDFYIDTCPVTNAEFLRFVEASRAPLPATWARGRFPRERADHPVTGVAWQVAVAYSAWAGKRLPTTLEWEKSARGTDGRRYPWGSEFDARWCNTREQRLRSTTPVRLYPQGASPYGVLDLIGNVWEWTADEEKARGRSLGQDRTKRVLKGGAWDVPGASAACSVQSAAWPEEQLEYVGFRCARAV